MKTNSFIWLMALVMSLALVGCKGNDGNNPDDPNNKEEQTITKIEETDDGHVTLTYSDGTKMFFLIRLYMQEDKATVVGYTTPQKPEDRLYDVIIPSEVSWHGKSYPVVNALNAVFEGNKRIKSVKTQKNLTSLEYKCFCACSALEYASVMYVDEIPQSCFAECTKLTTVEIGEHVMSIKSYAYLGCNAIKDFTIYASEPPSLSENCFTDGAKFILHVPNKSIDKYKSSEWKEYASSIVAI